MRGNEINVYSFKIGNYEFTYERYVLAIALAFVLGILFQEFGELIDKRYLHNLFLAFKRRMLKVMKRKARILMGTYDSCKENDENL